VRARERERERERERGKHTAVGRLSQEWGRNAQIATRCDAHVEGSEGTSERRSGAR